MQLFSYRVRRRSHATGHADGRRGRALWCAGGDLFCIILVFTFNGTDGGHRPLPCELSRARADHHSNLLTVGVSRPNDGNLSYDACHAAARRFADRCDVGARRRALGRGVDEHHRHPMHGRALLGGAASEGHKVKENRDGSDGLTEDSSLPHKPDQPILRSAIDGGCYR